MNKIETIKDLTRQLNEYRNEYYNRNSPSVSDSVYDALYDRLVELERETGCIMSDSPTQTVGYNVVSNLEKVAHPTPLLSLDKTKQFDDVRAFIGDQTVMVMLKLDGLTVELDYEEGVFMEASTRGNGIIGEIITHNARTFKNIPLTIPYKKKLRIAGEAYINAIDFECMRNDLVDSNGKPYKNSRNLAAGSVRCLDANECKERLISYAPFNVLEGLDDVADPNSKNAKLDLLETYGFDCCKRCIVKEGQTLADIDARVAELRDIAEVDGYPIDGIVVTYDDIGFSSACGRTEHHNKDGLALKFEDDLYETVLRSIEWNPTRTGDICPVGIFDTVEIDGCDVSRATLHNISFIKGLDLCVGNRIMVCKRNMIIPHIEENLDKGHWIDALPLCCPCCGTRTRVRMNKKDKDTIIETLYCDNPLCAAKRLQQFVHFVEKPAANIEGMSEATLERFIEKGWIDSYADIYHLDEYRNSIIGMDGFGEKSYERLWHAIETSRSISFERFLVAIDIPKIGKTASRIIAEEFGGDIERFEQAISEGFDFTKLPDFGDTLHNNITQWFMDENNTKTWKELKNEMKFKKTNEGRTIIPAIENPFVGRTVVATGKFENFSRDGINIKLMSLGAKPGSSVTKNTDYVIVGEKAGSKLSKARELEVPVLTETEFLVMIGEV